MSTSRSDQPMPRPGARRAVALQYGVSDSAPVVVASGMGYLAERILDVAQENGVPVYEDNSLATVLSQLRLGQEIPEELYRAIVEIYVYFLNFDPDSGTSATRNGAAQSAAAQTTAPATQNAAAPPDETAAEGGSA